MAASALAIPVAAPPAAPAPTTISESLNAAFAAVPPPALEAPAADPVVSPAITEPTAPVTPDPATVDPDLPVDPNAPVVAAPVEVDPEPDPFSEITADSVSPDGRKHFFSLTKSAKLQEHHKLVLGIQEILPDVSVDSVRSVVQKANSAEAMMNLYRQGPQDAGAMDEVLSAFVADDPTAFGVMAIRAAMHLPQVNPEAAKAIRGFEVQRILNDSKASLRQIQDPTKQAEEINFIQNMELRLTGRYTPREQLLAGLTQDPMQAQMQYIEQEKQKIANFQRSQATIAQQAKIQSIDTAENSAVTGQIDAVLEPLKASFKPDDVEFMRARFEAVIKQTEASHPEWAQMYNNLRMNAERTGSAEAIERLANWRKGITQRIVAQNSKTIVGSRVATVQAANQAAHQQAQTVPNTELSPNGVTAPAPNGAVDAMRGAKNWNQMFSAAGWK